MNHRRWFAVSAVRWPVKFVDLSASAPSVVELLEFANKDNVYLHAPDGRAYALTAVEVEPSHPYLLEMSRPLVKALEHAAALPTHRLVGYAANIDFWADEVGHYLAISRG